MAHRVDLCSPLTLGRSSLDLAGQRGGLKLPRWTKTTKEDQKEAKHRVTKTKEHLRNMSEEVLVTLSGGAPWGFRLQGGAEHQMPLQVSKVRKRSKACRAGLREMDELVFINDASCRTLSHAQAMNLIDNDRGTLHLRIKRAPAAYQSVVLLGRAPSPRIDKEYLAALRSLSPPLNPKLPGRTLFLSPINGLECLTSPPDSEAYYGETDSDADVVAQEKQRRQRRRSPSSSPAKSPQVSPQEEELSGYESTQDICVLPRNYSLGTGPPQQHRMHGVARREVVFEPTQSEWSHRAENSSDNSDQSPSGTGEVDSGFQEPPTVPPPLVSPQRAKEALMLASHLQMVPMVGPVSNPVDEELSVTYMDKAKQAKLHRGESVQDKQVKEARTKCRTIASLLTDAPNPHSKGVLMFKKRRQRAKKYTLTCFGSVDGESCSNTEGETEDESLFPGSESEFDEEGFSAAPDPTWDSGYLDILDKRTSACVVPDREAELSPGLNATSGKGAQLFEQQRKRAEEHNLAQSFLPMPQLQVDPTPTYTSVSPVIPLNSSNGKPLVVSKTSVMLSSPAQTPMPVMPEGFPEQANMLSASIVHNRTARPFNPGCVSHRASTAPVVFRPNAAKKAVSVATIPTFISSSNTEGRKAVSTTSLYIPARPATVNGPAMLSPTKMTSGPFSPPPSNYSQYSQNYPNPSTPFSPVSSQSTSLSSVPYCPSQKQTCLSPPCQMVPCQYQPSSAVQAPTTILSPSFTSTNASTPAPPYSATATKPILQNSPAHKVSFNPYISVATSFPDTPDAPVTHQYPLSKPTEGIYSQEQRTTVSGARTGILQDAQRRGAKKPMFTTQEEKAAPSYNPELLSLVQNLDDKSRSGVEAGFESGPEEDYLNLGAEACNFMQAQKHKMPPPVAPKPAYSAPESLQMQGKGAELFARRQSRMDRYVVDKHTKSSTPPRDPSPTPSLPALWKYSPNIRAPPPINYNPLLSPSCPPGAQRGSKSNDLSKVGVKAMSGQLKPGIKALDFMSRQPYQLNSSLFCYGGGVPQNTPTYPQNDARMMGNSLHLPKQVPVKANRVYEIKRFSTPTPMSAPTSLTPTVIAPRSATTLGQPMWRDDVTSPPLIAPRPMAPFSPPPPVPNAPLPALPNISMAPKTNADLISQTPSAQTCGSFQSAKQFKSAPELSPLSPGFRASGSWSIQNLRVPRPNFSTSSVGLQPKVWRPGSVLY